MMMVFFLRCLFRKGQLHVHVREDLLILTSLWTPLFILVCPLLCSLRLSSDPDFESSFATSAIPPVAFVSTASLCLPVDVIVDGLSFLCGSSFAWCYFEVRHHEPSGRSFGKFKNMESLCLI